MTQLQSQLREFKMAGMVNSLEERITYANENKLSYREFLELLCEDEQSNRKSNSYKKSEVTPFRRTENCLIKGVKTRSQIFCFYLKVTIQQSIATYVADIKLAHLLILIN